MTHAAPFLFGQPPETTVPLARYLPPVPKGVTPTWLKARLPGDRSTSHPWILDPFGASPQLAIELARAGYRVLVAANNPVTRFLIEIAADPPTEDELRAALADLAASRKGDERLEPHIRSLYQTICANCDRPVMADAFLWERESMAPYARLYRCPHCGDTGERPVISADKVLASHFKTSGLHQARALERIAPPNDPDRQHAEEALEVYLPRAIYVLFNLINKLAGFTASSSRQQLSLAALLLCALDRANTLWPHPTARARPRQLTIPPRFRENNIWLALEEAIDLVKAPPDSRAIPLMIWPKTGPDQGGLTIFEGRLKDLAGCLPQLEIAAVVAALPRPNQAFWTLSALWAGWLWGQEAAAHFKPVLRRRRYDWGWHSSALQAALSSLAPQLASGTPFFALIGDVEPGFLTSAFIASARGGFHLESVALSEETSQAQLSWTCAQPTPEKPPQPALDVAAQGNALQKVATRAALGHLAERGEPASYLHLHTAALVAQAGSGALAEGREIPPAEFHSIVQDSFESAFTFNSGFLRLGGSEKSLEVGQWWVQLPEKVSPPLSDRIEMAFVRFLVKNYLCTEADITSQLTVEFPGLLTPDPNFIQACLASYAEADLAQKQVWRLRGEDQPAARRRDLSTARQLLEELGNRLGYQVDQPEIAHFPQLWHTEGQSVFTFYLTASAVVSEIIASHSASPTQAIIVLPGGRANLVVYKLRANPILRQAINKGWRFLKFRQLRWLFENASLTREIFSDQLSLDPLTEESPQLRLL